MTLVAVVPMGVLYAMRVGMHVFSNARGGRPSMRRATRPAVYKSLTSQSLHYFARPHAAVVRTPISHPSAWRGSELKDRADWRVQLTPAQIAEIDRGLDLAESSGHAIGDMRREDFPLPTLEGELERWRREVKEGRGFVLVRGAPVERWSLARAERFFFGLGLHLGTPGAQNPAGELLGHVRDTGANAQDASVRLYKTRERISYHCDVADAVGLLCLQTPKSGGQSRIVSSVSVYNALLRRRPDLVDRLYEPFAFDAHGENGLDWFPITPCRSAGGRLSTFYHADYFRSGHKYPGALELTARDQELLDLYDDLASSPELYLDMQFERGDIQLVSNHTLLHARTDYEDHPEPERKRHLLRLWLSFEGGVRLIDRARRLRSVMQLVATLGVQKLRSRGGAASAAS
jgi:hypothetical protein